MDRLQKLQLRQSELRTSIADLLDQPVEKRADTYQGDLDGLTGQAKGLESEIRAALVITPDPNETRLEPDAEGREVRALIAKASVGRIVESVIAGRAVDGPERELQARYQLSANVIPLDLLEERDEGDQDLERRAAATFSAGGEPHNQRPIIARVFPQSAARWCGVQFERVPTGQATYPVLTTGAVAGTPDKSAAQAESTAAFTIHNLTPGRVQASFSYAVEDAATFPSIDSALRAELTAALEDKLDERVVNLTDAGLLQFGTDPTGPGAASDYAAYIAAMYGGVDGKFAGSISDVKMLVGHAVYSHMASVYRSTNSNKSALDVLGEKSGGVRVGGNVPPYASNSQDAVVVKGSGRRNAVVALWGGVEVIPDPFTRAAEGERRLFGVMLYAFKVLRQDGFSRARFRTS